ncbi:MAG: sigma-54 dependent transcriptional regulator [Proteobacteria bacterium]|nr:sigma-54 dependent transcriptional regulator [Pseudomonadota bacterium]MBU4470215.1 sigma-54 dependent transcriptional regulator [Pseudomonadota bacterium]
MADRILVVDDDALTLKNLRRILEKEGYSVSTYIQPRKALERLGEEPYDLLISDVQMPDMDGFALLEQAKRISRGIEVVLITGFASLDDAVEATKRGSYHYLAKPFDPGKVRDTVKKALAEKKTRDQVLSSGSGMLSKDPGPTIIGESLKIKQLKETILQISPTDCNVMIIGESGTGKELVARSVHARSRRSRGPFIAFNCAAFAEDLIANELFGHEKQAFTGASSLKKGLLETANSGTVFLDEIGDMPPAMQSKLLRVVQERELIRVGGIQPIPLDIRFISATAVDLKTAVADGHFRQDLYFRLNVVNMVLPTLAERREDIPLLAYHILRHSMKRTGKSVTSISEDSLALLENYAFPGNVRELENILERAVALCEGETIRNQDLPSDLVELDLCSYSRPTGNHLSLDELEKDYISHVLNLSEGSRSRAAQILGIERTSLWRKMKKYGLL